MNKLVILQVSRKRKGEKLYQMSQNWNGSSADRAKFNYASWRGEVEDVFCVVRLLLAKATLSGSRLHLKGGDQPVSGSGHAGRLTGRAHWQVRHPPPARTEEEAEASIGGRRWCYRPPLEAQEARASSGEHATSNGSRDASWRRWNRRR